MLFISGLAESILQIKYGVEEEAEGLHMKLEAISGCGLDWMFRFWCYLNNNPCRPDPARKACTECWFDLYGRGHPPRCNAMHKMCIFTLHRETPFSA